MASLRAIEVYEDSRRRLIAIQSTELAHDNASPISRLFGRVEPIALIICGADGIDALSMQAESIDLDRLRSDVPGLDSMMTSYRDA